MKKNGSILLGIIINLFFLITVYVIPFIVLFLIIKLNSFLLYSLLIILYSLSVILLKILITKIYKRIITRKVSKIDKTINQILGYNSRPVWGGVWGKVYLSLERKQLKLSKSLIKLEKKEAYKTKNYDELERLYSSKDEIPCRYVTGSSIFEALICTKRILNKSL